MKRIILPILTAATWLVSVSGKTMTYAYDSSGNMVNRELRMQEEADFMTAEPLLTKVFSTPRLEE